MRTRWSAYAGVSVALAGGVIVKALAQRPNFYSAAVYLAQSSANLMILTNFIFVAACTILLGLQKLLYGPLRPIEIEQLYEKAWFAVTETCLAMTIFRGEIGAWFLIMFFSLLAGKVWAWIGEGRIEILEQQPPRNPRLFHTRLAASLALSVFFDLTMLEYVVKQVMHMARPDMMVMFGFEFAVLSIVSLSTAWRYGINLVEIAIIRKQKARRIDEIRRERIAAAVREVEENAQSSSEQQTTTTTSIDTQPNTSASVPIQAVEAARRALQQPIDEAEIEVEGWEGKGRWIFYLDLITDFFKLVIYLSFFFILLIFYGLPIHILRDVFMTFRSFFKRIGDFMRYRAATRDMNARYPDATEQDIGSEDVCIICREEMRPYHPPANGERPNPVSERMRPKKLPCGHILHFSCLRSWLERQQICPTCRTNVVSRTSSRPGQNNVPADAAGQHGNAPPAERQGPRVYQWGPLRIGIGAARGNMLEDLQQQLGDGQPRPGQQAQGEGPQQYGFGIRWEGLRRGDRGDRGQRSIQRQLDEVQRQISQEYRALGQMTNELRQLRNMEAELTRIRAQRQGGANTTPAIPQSGTTNPPVVHALTGNFQQVIPAGSDQLPTGLALPEGWSLMPLHPAQFGPNHTVIPGVPANLQPVPQGVQPTHPVLNGIQNQATPILPQPHHHNDQRPNGVLPGVQSQHVHANTGQSGQHSSESMGTPDEPAAIRHALNATDMGSSSIPARHHSMLSNGGSTDRRFDSFPEVQATNGATRTTEVHDNATTQSAPARDDDPPVASMFTLPSWGSAPMEPSTSNRAANDTGEASVEEAHSDSASSSDTGSAIQEPAENPSASLGRRKNPTVEDLVEDPD